MADALVEHDKKMAKRIAQILKSDDPEAKLTNGVGDDTAAIGAGVGTAGAQRGRSGEAAQLIMYEEQRRQRDEIEAIHGNSARLAARRQELQHSTRQAVGQAEELRGKSTALMRELRSVQQRGAGG